MSAERKTDTPDDALAAEYVLGVLPHAERQAFAARLEHDADLRDRVRFWNEQLMPMADEIEPVEPPATVLAAAESRLFPTTTPVRGLWSSLQFWRGLAFASIAALVVAGVYLAVLPGPQPQETTSYVAEISGEAGAVRLVAYLDVNDGLLRLNRTDGSPAAGRDFELWLIEGGNNPVSLGVLPAGEKAALSIPGEYKDRLDGAILAVSDEPAGGSPTGQPTGPVLATGKVVEI